MMQDPLAAKSRMIFFWVRKISSLRLDIPIPSGYCLRKKVDFILSSSSLMTDTGRPMRFAVASTISLSRNSIPSISDSSLAMERPILPNCLEIVITYCSMDILFSFLV